ncbi:MAG: hypothetical protein KAJ52_01565 [Sedimentisphaerales bacterium]|nr:hypothetical protein [Sedimentisphaerales bacterium]
MVKANRNPRAWLIFIPLLAVSLLWTIFKQVMPLPSSALSMFDQLFISLIIGISIVLLFGHKIGNRNRFITFLLAVVLMVVVGIAGVISYSGFAFSSQVAISAIMFAVMTLTMLPAFVFAGCCCRKRYGNLRFMLWLAVWTITVCVVIILGYFGIAVSIMGSMPGELISVLLQISVTGLVLGSCLYVIILPFMILVLRSGFFRERFYACLRLRSMPETVGYEADAGLPGEQAPDP